ncbi:MAG: hypothetical protein Q9214_006413, partial [Letrouitia sp. 1 TL-2023]
WDALENMIRQCFDDGSVSYSGSQRQTSGVYDYNGEHYTLSIESSSNYAGSNDEPRQEAMVIGVDEDPDTSGGDYVWGPTNYCIGLGPGGGQSCTKVPNGCYIISSFDNTIPNPPICG